ncbi:unnamed protein product [Protopolystoma xenopodis]|uniref:Major facilitator superfamily (MFS) profile domain-containing protein n=1 Tax=Protopolystoma xenopodis TaxID=117903 RepID=A0A3S5CBW5_9PLAT|nr:unnamed protein product [Protopolystoma xenopodis]
MIFIFTFFIYICFHASRKPISVVKSALHLNCTEDAIQKHLPIPLENSTECCWKPFDQPNYDSLYGTLDLAFLLSYAISMFFSGHIAERMDLRIYLGLGCLMCALTTAAFGMGYFWEVHAYSYYLMVQILGGVFQATGWPAVVTCMGNWFGKSRSMMSIFGANIDLAVISFTC